MRHRLASKRGGTMKSFFAVILLMGCMLWPARADLSDCEPIVQYSLPADIMQVEFANETWIYRLYEDGTVKKVVNKSIYAKTAVAFEEKAFPKS